ncbi:MAG: helix-turn-helix domain-containing protein [Actinomycetota bacterium]|nr:helix-turn-helix domain-containing protein [Actinomycetota bacterium]
MNMRSNDRLYTIEEVTEMLGVSEQEIMNMITLKKLPAVETGDSIKVREEDMETFLDSLDSLNNKNGDDRETDGGKKAEQDGEEREEIGEEYEIEDRIEDDKARMEDSYKDLLRKKQELEEDINYLQCKYDEFKKRLKKIISEEFKLFLKKIDAQNLQGDYRIKKEDFDSEMDNNGLGIDNSIDTIEENGKNSYSKDEEILFAENNEKGEET